MTTAYDRLAAVLADRYRIERELGQGGMATVYLAHDIKHGRDVALKVLRPELAAMLGSERFLNEVRITSRLQHPHIVTLIDSGETDGFLWYVLPYIRGESLRHRLDREKQLGVEDALAITRQVAGALDYAHKQRVIHRDIKPENILLHEGEAMLADFGIALAVQEAGGNRLTETGLSLGTPQYMSPEQATGQRDLDARSDVYSLGAVLYEMLAGEPPVNGPNARAIIAKLMTEAPTRLRVVRDSVPEGVDDAAAKALAKVPADRYASAAEFVRALSLPGVLPVTAARPRPHSLKLAFVGIAVVALAAVAWFALRPQSRPSTQITPQFEQLTTDGNARSPALSPDGTRLAYVATDCDERERCTDRLVVGDTGGAGSTTLLSRSRIVIFNWASGGRFLIALLDDASGHSGIFSIPVLGGAPRLLDGTFPSVVGTTDTVLMSPDDSPTAEDTITWLRLVTASDGSVRDSVLVRRSGFAHRGFMSPDGGRIAVVDMSAAIGNMILLLDRTGAVTDSLVLDNGYHRLYWAPRGDALLWQAIPVTNYSSAPGASAPVSYALLRRRVSADGRFIGRTDSLLQLQPGSQLRGVRPDGTALLVQRPVDAVVIALERSGPGLLDFRSRRLTSSTGGLQVSLSRDGATVWLKHGGGGGVPRRDAFLPFEGGNERPFTLPKGDEISEDWTFPAPSALLYAVQTPGHVRLAEITVATGQVRDLGELPQGTDAAYSIPGGGYSAANFETHSARVIGRPGRPDTTWVSTVVPARLFLAPSFVSNDGRAYYEWSSSSRRDTAYLRRVPLDGGAVGPEIAVPRKYFIALLADESIEYADLDPSGVLGWYRIPPGGGRATRLGDAPLQGTDLIWNSSDDGRRWLVVKPVDRPDVYLIRNFGELLDRR